MNQTFLVASISLDSNVSCNWWQRRTAYRQAGSGGTPGYTYRMELRSTTLLLRRALRWTLHSNRDRCQWMYRQQIQLLTLLSQHVLVAATALRQQCELLRWIDGSATASRDWWNHRYSIRMAAGEHGHSNGLTRRNYTVNCN